jgi:hypothetical protein
LGKTEAEIRANLRDLFQAEIGQPTPNCQRRLNIPQFPPVENSPIAPVEKSPGAERL